MFPFSDNIPRLHPPIVTYVLIVLNCWVFFQSLRLSEDERNLLAYRHGFVPARSAQLLHDRTVLVDLDRPLALRDRRTGSVRRIEQLAYKQGGQSVVMTLFTCMFMHGSWMHLIGNMWMLWIFGDNVEDRLGLVKYTVFYLGGGIVATLCHWANDPASTVPIIGASGAIAAVLGGYAVTWPHARVKTFVFIVLFVTIIEIPALVFLGVWFVTQLLHAREDAILGMSAGVAWWAHIGGFVFGAVLMPLLRDEEPPVPYPDRIVELNHGA